MQITIKTVLYKIWESGNICRDNTFDFYQKISKTSLFCLGLIRPSSVANILETLIDECEAQRHEGASLVNLGHNQSDSTNVKNHIHISVFYEIEALFNSHLAKLTLAS